MSKETRSEKEPSTTEFISFIIFFILGVVVAAIGRDRIIEFVIGMLSAIQQFQQ